MAKRFKFRFDTMLKIRRQREDEQKRVVAERLRQIAQTSDHRLTLQRQILTLIRDLRDRFSMGVLFISHDLGVVHEVSDRVSVIYAGRIVESAPRQRLFGEPLHPYTRLLLASIPDARKRGQRQRAIPGRVPDAEHVPQGCAFHPRCPLAEEVCGQQVPPLREHGPEHAAACLMIGSTPMTAE